MSAALPFPMPAPALRPFDWTDYEDEVLFDPAVHMALPAPEEVKKLPRVLMSEVAGCKADDSLAYAEPFRVFSDEGLRVLRDTVERDRSHGMSSERHQMCLRGTAYRSKWWRDACCYERITEIASELAGTPLLLSTLHSNLGHINIGQPKGEDASKAVDCWHADSVSYVVVVLCTNMEGSVGGELEVLLADTQDAFAMLRAGDNERVKQHTKKIEFPGPGYGLFFQGSKLVHHVTPLVQSNDERITFVISFIEADPFATDTTRLQTYTIGVTAPIGRWEWTLHQAWKYSKQLEAFRASRGWCQDGVELAKELRRVAAELNEACDLLEGKKEDEKIYVES